MRKQNKHVMVSIVCVSFCKAVGEVLCAASILFSMWNFLWIHPLYQTTEQADDTLRKSFATSAETMQYQPRCPLHNSKILLLNKPVSQWEKKMSVTFPSKTTQKMWIAIPFHSLTRTKRSRWLAASWTFWHGGFAPSLYQTKEHLCLCHKWHLVRFFPAVAYLSRPLKDAFKLRRITE